MIQDFIQRLERTRGPDRQIDDALHELMPKPRVIEPPKYTRSIDAALTLLPNGWSYRVAENEPRTNAQAVVGRSHPTNKVIYQEASTPALALCIAAIKARATS